MELDICVDVPLCSSLKRVFSQLSMGVLLLFFVSICGAAWGTHLPLPSCDSSSIWVRRLGWDAALLVIASEMNYLADSETGGGGGNCNWTAPSLPPWSLYLKLLHLQCRRTFSIRTQTHKMLTPLQNQFFPLPCTMASAKHHIDAGWFHRLIVHGHMHTRPLHTLALLFTAQRQTLFYTLSLHLLVMLCSKYSPIWGAL